MPKDKCCKFATLNHTNHGCESEELSHLVDLVDTKMIGTLVYKNKLNYHSIVKTHTFAILPDTFCHLF